MNKDLQLKKVSLKFEEIHEELNSSQYSNGCSGGRSDCCTRVCTKANGASDSDSLEAWDKYLEVNAGVLQY